MKRIPIFSMIVALVLIVTTVSSCKKDEKTTLPAENAPISKTYFLGGYNISTTGSGNYEYGTKFEVAKNGKITKLGCRMPTANTYRVTLWDATDISNPTVLAQSNVIQTQAQTLTFNDITSVAVSTGKSYFVTIWSSGSWNYILPVAGGNISYPITNGNIIIKGFSWISAAYSPVKFPTIVDNTYCAGIADFEYQADPF